MDVGVFVREREKERESKRERKVGERERRRGGRAECAQQWREQGISSLYAQMETVWRLE